MMRVNCTVLNSQVFLFIVHPIYIDECRINNRNNSLQSITQLNQHLFKTGLTKTYNFDKGQMYCCISSNLGVPNILAIECTNTSSHVKKKITQLFPMICLMSSRHAMFVSHSLYLICTVICLNLSLITAL